MRKRGLHDPRCLDLRGKRFGSLQVQEIDSRRTTRVFWKCLCDCGTVKSVASKHLVKGNISTCGCSRFLKGKHNKSWKGYEDISGRYWERCKKNAHLRNLAFDIDIEYAWSIFVQQNGLCALSGIPLEMRITASLDRIDSTIGYVEGNIQWVHKDVNRLKMDLSEESLFFLCKKIVEHRKL